MRLADGYGRYCIALRTFDVLGRPSTRQVNAWYDHVEPPPPPIGGPPPVDDDPPPGV